MFAPFISRIIYSKAGRLRADCTFRVRLKRESVFCLRMRSSAESQALFDRALQWIPGGVNSPVRAFRAVGGNPFFAVRANGATVWDVDDNFRGGDVDIDGLGLLFFLVLLVLGDDLLAPFLGLYGCTDKKENDENERKEENLRELSGEFREAVGPEGWPNEDLSRFFQ